MKNPYNKTLMSVKCYRLVVGQINQVGAHLKAPDLRALNALHSIFSPSNPCHLKDVDGFLRQYFKRTIGHSIEDLEFCFYTKSIILSSIVIREISIVAHLNRSKFESNSGVQLNQRVT